MAKKTTTGGQAPWDRKRPAGKKKTKLTAASRAKAKSDARKAGRKYPNLVDNMHAAASQGSRKKASSGGKRKTSGATRKTTGTKRKTSSAKRRTTGTRKTSAKKKTTKRR